MTELAELRAEVRELSAMVRQLLDAKSRSIPDHPVSPVEAGKILGKHEKTIRRWILRGKLPAKVEGKSILIRPVDLQKFLEPQPA